MWKTACELHEGESVLRGAVAECGMWCKSRYNYRETVCCAIEN